MPLEWRIILADGYSVGEHLEFLGRALPLNSWISMDDQGYWVTFQDQDQEQELLLSIRKDPRAISVCSVRDVAPIMNSSDQDDETSHKVNTLQFDARRYCADILRSCDLEPLECIASY